MEDFLIILAWVFFCALLRWCLYSRHAWLRHAIGYLCLILTVVTLRYSKLSFEKTFVVLLGILAFTAFCVWLVQYLNKPVTYMYRVFRGAAREAKKKADNLADS